MTVTYPPKLMPGDLIRVVAPSRSRAMVAEHDHSTLIEQRFAEMELRISYGAHVDERDSLDSSTIESRVADIHAAFADPKVAGVQQQRTPSVPELGPDCGQSKGSLRLLGHHSRAERHSRAFQPGTASGRVVGGNLCTLNLLQGTPHMPALDGALLFLEDDYESHPATFARDLTSLLQVPDAGGITGLLIGRFQRASRMTRHLLERIVRTQPGLNKLPVLANADFGHTQPQITLPIGGRAELTVGPTTQLRITSH